METEILRSMPQSHVRHLAASRAWILAWILLATLILGLPSIAAAERAWVRGDIRLNVRSGPGTQYRILGGVATGDGLAILKRNESWTQVRMDDGVEGWIPVGYLNPEPPPTLRLEQVEAELATLKEEFSVRTREAETLRTSNQELSTQDTGQRSEIDRLTLENTKLRAGARYPEMITGATILALGMVIGAILRRTSRRTQSRIRL